MYKIQTLNTIAPIGLNQFPKNRYKVASSIEHPDAVLVRSHNMHEMTLPSSVRVVGRAGAGVNTIPVDRLTTLGIPVLNTPGANANAVKELVLAGMLIASRNLFSALMYLDQLNENDESMHQKIESEKKQFIGFELRGKTLGVIGLGSIGVKVANAALSLGMKVIGYDPTITVHRAWELSSDVIQAHTVDELLVESDFVTFHIPLTSETKGMMDASRFALVKKGTVLLNFARDGIVDKKALKEALNEEKVFAYVTDFPCAELRGFKRVISLPHLGASTKEAEENCAVMIVKQVRDFLEQGTISHSVNFPSIDMPRNINATRIAISNRNVPNMVAQISKQLGDAKLNILSLLNRSKDEVAYTLIDVDAELPKIVVDDIAHIEGVLQVRVIG